ncbi:hypothetical protein [Rhizobium sp. X9]|uniref:hypothetical protein n=1 Tax=Rhizobium sp. X9 TaxID=2815360 RepID=UPI001C0B77E9|nr:hypothetical protein [Rhizobium sp. X9]
MTVSKENTTTLPAAFARHYEKLNIDSKLRKRLETSASKIFDLGRRTTEQTFELGDHLDEAAVLLDDGVFDKWVKLRCGIAPRTARGYMSVFRNLADFRDELVDLSVGTTALFHLAHAPHEKIREAIAHAEEHGQLRVFDVKTILTNGEEVEDKKVQRDFYGAGGVTGLKALIAIKARDGLKMFVVHIDVIVQAIKTALDQKRVIKEALAREVEDLARVARMELESLAQFVEPDSDLRRHPRSTQFPKKTEWAVVNETLQKLGLVDSWPKSKDLPGWLRDEVVPALEWSISKDRKPKWPLAPPNDAATVAPIVVEGGAEMATGDVRVENDEAPPARQALEVVPPLANNVEAERDGLDEASPAETVTA